MATFRDDVIIPVSAEELWRLVGDPTGVAEWFGSIESCVVQGDLRTCTLKRGGEVTERIVTVDDERRRFQYSIVDGIAVDAHLGTVDVIALSTDLSLLVYGMDVSPDRLAEPLGRSISTALAVLRERYPVES